MTRTHVRILLGAGVLLALLIAVIDDVHDQAAAPSIAKAPTAGETRQASPPLTHSRRTSPPPRQKLPSPPSLQKTKAKTYQLRERPLDGYSPDFQRKRLDFQANLRALQSKLALDPDQWQQLLNDLGEIAEKHAEWQETHARDPNQPSVQVWHQYLHDELERRAQYLSPAQWGTLKLNYTVASLVSNIEIMDALERTGSSNHEL